MSDIATPLRSLSRTLVHAAVLAVALAAALAVGVHAQSPEPSPDLAGKWLKALSSPDAEVRMRAMQSAQTFAGARDELVTALTPFLESTSAAERLWSACALGRFTPEALPVLFGALEHADPFVRRSAAEGIENSIWPRECKWEPRTTPSRPPVELQRRRLRCYELVRSQGVHALRKTLSSSSEDVQVLIAMTLWKLGPDAEAARSELKAAERSPSAVIRFWARHAIERGESPTEPAIDAEITERIKALQKELRVGGPAATELVKLGPTVVPALTEVFLQTARPGADDQYFAVIAWVLEQFGEDALPVLAIGLEHWHEDGQALSANGLFRAGPAALPALPAIFSAWRRNDRGVVTHRAGRPFWDARESGRVLEALASVQVANSSWDVARLGPRALPYLIDALDDTHAIVRVRSARALEEMGAAATAAVHALVERFADSDASVREAAAKAVLAIAPDDESVASRAREIVKPTDKK